MSLSADQDGNLYSTGYFNNLALFQEQVFNSNGFSDFFISKHNPAGELLWVISGGGSNPDRGLTIETDGGGSSIIAGFYTEAMHFQGNEYISPTDSRDIFIMKVDANGTPEWLNTFGLSEDDTPYDVHIGHDGSIYLAAQIQGTGTIEGVEIETVNYEDSDEASSDILFIKYDADGNFLWLKHGGNFEDDRGLAITSNDGGDIFLTGEFSENITFDQTYLNAVENACFVMKVDENGNEEWFNILAAYEVLIRDCKTNLNGDPVILVDHIGLLNTQTPFGNTQIPTDFDYNYAIIQLNTAGQYQWHASEGSMNQISSRVLTRIEDGSLYVAGEYRCSFTTLSEDWGPGIFYSSGYKDIFVCLHDANGVRQWERTIGGPFEDHLAGLVDPLGGDPVIAGGFEELINVPVTEIDSEFDPNHNLNISWIDGNSNTSVCGSEDYGHFLSSISDGSYDLFYSNFYHEDRPPYDYFRRDGVCFYDYLEPAIADGAAEVSGCSGTNLIGVSVNSRTGSCGLYSDFAGIGPGYTFLWSNDDTNSSTNLGPGNHWCTVTRNDECESFTDDIDVVVYPNPAIPCIVDNLDQISDSCAPLHSLIMCLPDSVILDPINPEEGVVYNWIWEGDDPLELGGDSIQVSGTGLYTYSAQNEFGCSSQSLTFVTANYVFPDMSPTLEFILDGDCTDGFTLVANDSITICPGEMVWGIMFDPENPYDFPESTAEWSIEGPLAYNATYGPCFTFGFVPGEEGWYNLSSSLTHGVACPNYYFLENDIHVTLVDEINGPPDAAICPGVANELEVTGAIEVTWTGPEGAYWEVTSPTTIDVYEQGTYTAQATFPAFDITCDVSITVTNIEPPAITMDPSNGIICPDQTVQMSAADGLDWAWIGPGGDIIDETQSAFVDGPGLYHCIVTDSTGCAMESNFLELQQYSSPFVFSEQGMQFCSLDPIQISVETNPSSEIEWSPPLNGNEQTMLISEPGTYTVSVTLCNITEQLEFVLIPSDTPSEISVDDPGVLCPGSLLTLYANSGMEGYSWAPENLNQDSLVVTEPGAYVLYTTDDDGCVGVSDTLWVEQYAVVEGEVEDQVVCFEDPASVYVDTQWDMSWYASLDDDEPFSTDNPLEIESVDTSVMLYFTVHDTVCAALIDSVLVDYYPLIPAPEMPDISVCWGENVEVLPASELSMLWLGGPYPDFTALDTLIIENVTEDIVIEVFELGGNECPSESTTFLIYNPIAGSDASIIEGGSFCEGDELELYTTLDAQTILWSTPNGDVLAETIDIEELGTEDEGEYSAILSEDDCLVEADAVYIQVVPYPVIEIDDESFYCWDGYYHITLNTDADYFLWQGIPGDSTYIIQYTGDYHVVAGNMPGCQVDATFYIDEVPCVPAPNVISPNDDELNDYIDFTLYFGAFDEIRIYNRWGNLISTHDMENSTWDGRDFNGNKVSDGVYYYGVSKNGERKSYYIHTFTK